MSVTPTGSSTAYSNSTSQTTSSATSALSSDFTTFLKMLTVQMQNQDPLNPMDNAEMTSQMAQMSTVSGIEKLNTTLNSLVDNIGTSQSMQAASMIGKGVLVPGSGLTLSDGAAYAGINLESAADQVTLKIMDSSGNVIYDAHANQTSYQVFSPATAYLTVDMMKEAVSSGTGSKNEW